MIYRMLPVSFETHARVLEVRDRENLPNIDSAVEFLLFMYGAKERFSLRGEK
jgi:hypothetical protein